MSLKSILGRPHKYGAVKTIRDGIKFDSKAEADYYTALSMHPIIEIVELQPKVYLTDAKILYKPDFLIRDSGELIWVDVKGMVTPLARLKKKLWGSYGPGLLRWVEKKGHRFELLSETNGPSKTN